MGNLFVVTGCPSGVRYCYVVRHGETEWNVSGRRQGQLDSPLTDRGLAQAHSVASILRQLAPDAIFVSPQERARATATVSAEALGLSMTVLEDLREMSHGALAGLTMTEIESAFPGTRQERQDNRMEWRFPGGESYRSTSRRSGLALAAVLASDAARPVLVTHEMTGRMIIGRLLEITPIELALDIGIEHGTVVEIDLRSHQVRQFVAGGPPVTHLSDRAGQPFRVP